MVVHIFPYKLYTKGFIDFTREKYEMDEHIFLVYGKCPNENFRINEDKNILFVGTPDDIVKMTKYDELVVQAKQIIIHSNNLLITKMFMKRPQWLKKSVIVFWGFDLYCYRNQANSLKAKIWDCIQKYQIRNAETVCFLADKEMEVVDKLIPGIKGNKKRAMYLISAESAKFQAMVDFHKEKDPVKIIVGNSASETNCHKDILNRLATYRNENIQVYCPLSYGSDAYRNEITSLGKELFLEKFIPITDLMPYEEYFVFANTCSIAFFNNDRQQAMGNILMMLEQGGKVFLRRDTPMWELFKKQGYIISNISDVGNVDWTEITSYSEKEQSHNARICAAGNSTEAAKKIWDKIYS